MNRLHPTSGRCSGTYNSNLLLTEDEFIQYGYKNIEKRTQSYSLSPTLEKPFMAENDVDCSLTGSQIDFPQLMFVPYKGVVAFQSKL